MKRYTTYLIIILFLTSCTEETPTTVSDDQDVIVNTESQQSTATTNQPSQTVPEYQFDIEKMSPLTGKFISQEEWLL